MKTANAGTSHRRIDGSEPGLLLVHKPKPKLLDQLRESLGTRHYSRRIEQTYCHWAKRFIHFHNLRHLGEMGGKEINAFLTYLAVNEKVSPRFSDRALMALAHVAQRVMPRTLAEVRKAFMVASDWRRPLTPDQRLGAVFRRVLLVRRLLRTSRPATRLFGPLYKVNHRRLEIILNFDCDLLCVDCSIQCRQAPSAERMSVEQIERFVQESISQNRRWEIIRLIGGEPTLHPDLPAILQRLAVYRRSFSPQTLVQLCTNGFSPRVREVLAKLPDGIAYENSSKMTTIQSHHIAVNYGPVDQAIYRRCCDFSNSCEVCVTQGLGLSAYGYYHCNVAAAVDRVFGMNLGKKQMPPADALMLDAAAQLCRLCGFFRAYQRKHFDTGYVSPSWQVALAKYSLAPPVLTRY